MSKTDERERENDDDVDFMLRDNNVQIIDTDNENE
jgi:hypothetical protein